MDRKRGIFVVIEGIDGTGKSTLAAGLLQAMRKRGLDALRTFEPTEGKWGAILRNSFTGARRLTPEEELDLFLRDRREHVSGVIGPAIEQGRSVVCDRYYLSTMAYQGARGMDMNEIRKMNEAFALHPDLVLLLELPVSDAMARITGGRGDTLNNFEEEEYLSKVAANFASIEMPGLVRIDARQPPDQLVATAMEHIEPLVAKLS